MMQMFRERVWPVQIEVDGKLGEARLYAQFHRRSTIKLLGLFPEPALNDALRDRQVLTGATTCRESFRAELLRHVLAPLGPGNWLRFRHSLFGRGFGVRNPLEVTETLRTNRETEENESVGHLDIVTALEAQSVSGQGYSVESIFQIPHIMWLWSQEGHFIDICGSCKHGVFPVYGDEDQRHGLYCARDVEDFSNLKHEADAAVWERKCWSCVDAFHWCPRFESRFGHGEKGA